MGVPGEGRGVEWHSEMSAQLGEPQRLCPLLAHVLPYPSSWVWAEAGVMCPGMDPPRAQGKAGVLGVSQDSCQCLWPTRGSPEFGDWDEFIKHNRVEPKK